MFEPHVLVVPTGTVIVFPNRDPYFHNVFSLFDGKRFDLGLYEAGTAKEVLFSREGLSYVFCNIHSEMSAVVIALNTSVHALADSQGVFLLKAVPPGDYELHIWIEGEKQPVLERLTRRIHVDADNHDLGVLPLTAIPSRAAAHQNLYGQPYKLDTIPPY